MAQLQTHRPKVMVRLNKDFLSGNWKAHFTVASKECEGKDHVVWVSRGITNSQESQWLTIYCNHERA